MAKDVAQKNNNERPATRDEMRRAIFFGRRVKYDTNPDRYGYLYRGELYVPNKDEEQ